VQFLGALELGDALRETVVCDVCIEGFLQRSGRGA
jgi:hypothetical protein